MKHPLKVIYPYGGIHYLLHWWTYNDRGHLALAKSLSTLEQTAGVIFRDHPDAEIKNLLKIKIVAPSNASCKKALKIAKNDLIDSFMTSVLYRIRDYFETTGTVPSLFCECTIWENKYNFTIELDEDEARTHSSCKFCNGTKIKLAKLIPTQFYKKYLSEWEKHFPSQSYTDKKSVYSLAEQAKDNQILWGANPNFGHHSSGLDIQKLDKDDTRLVQFYFVKLKTLDATKLQSMLAYINEEIDKKSKLDRGIKDLEKLLEKQHRHNLLLEIFK